MPDTYLTISQLNVLFQAMILDILGYEKTGSPADYSNAAYAAVRVAWPIYGAPAWKVSEDVVFIHVTEEDEPINRQREVVYTDSGLYTLDEEISYTRVLSLNLIFYGPTSFHNAQLVRDSVFRETYRRVLSQNKIFLIPDIVAPRRAPEPFQSQWWERTDLDLSFNEKIKKTDEISIIEIADIIIITDSGKEREITVTAE